MYYVEKEKEGPYSRMLMMMMTIDYWDCCAREWRQ